MLGCCSAALGPRAARADDIRAASIAAREPITVAADWCTHWREGVYDVWHLRGNCYLNQGITYARAPEAVIWIDARNHPQQPIQVIAYFEGAAGANVNVDYGNVSADAAKNGVLGRQESPTWFYRMQTSAPLVWKLPPAVVAPAERPPIYARGFEQFNPDRRRQLLLAQYNELAPTAGAPAGLPPGMRKFTLFPRSDSPGDFQIITLASGEKAAILSGGARLLIEGLSSSRVSADFGPLGIVDISADRVVVWASGVTGSGGNAGLQAPDQPLEVYMQGNIEFRQGDRVVFADEMFYDARRQIGVILNAEMLTPLPTIDGYNYPGLVRFKANAIRMLDDTHFSAHNALVTTSRLGHPAYDVTASELTFTDVQQPVVDPLTGAPLVTPDGELVVHHQTMAESRGNVIHVRGVPVFYWPRLATDLEKPSFIIDRVKLGNDAVFGSQVLVDWDLYQLLGMRNPPEGTDWGLSTDYLSERGIGVGTDFQYSRPEALGFIGPAHGDIDFWAINDDGLDNLGAGRNAIVPEEDFRFRLSGEHRQRLESGWDVAAEVGWLSDRTFLEQYYEAEWDQFRDPRNGVRLKRLTDNRSLSIEANGQINEFFSEVEHMPRLDHTWLGESLLGDRLTYFEHTQVSYSRFNVATVPTEPTLASQYSELPWESNSEGERLITSHEIDLPLQAGPVKFVPYGMVQLGHWGEDLNGNEMDRVFGQTGVRASLPIYAVFPNVRDPLFNLNGLAHKVVFDAEFSYADTDENFDDLPLYDPLDDISIIEFRRRLFDGTLPPTITDPKFDPRRFAIRSGMQNWVTSPSAETVEDLMAVRMGVRQRLQTKRGPAGNQHIVDWLTLDMNATLFPDADRDNFGQELGLIDYDMRWHVGDRFSILSDGYADLFGDGLRTVSGGILMNRPTVGNFYTGVRSITGPVTSNVLLGSFAYRFSDKWIGAAGAAYDFESTGNIGHSVSITRVGESFNMTTGFTFDSSKDNFGLTFLLEPRFLPGSRLMQTTGIDVPPAGALGLE